MQDLVFSKKFDNALKQTAKSSGVVEAVLEHESVKELWDQVLATLQNEDAERKAAEKLQVTASDGDAADLAEELEQVRKPPSQHSEGSEKYWKAVGNQTVRTYCTFAVEPKTLDGVIGLVSQSPLREFSGEEGKSSVLTHLDMDGLGESIGPGQRPLLRKKFNAELSLLKKLVHGAMIGRGGQRKDDECTCPPPGEMVFIHTGFDRSSKEAESLFRPGTARSNANIDAELKEICLCFSDASIRGRKQRCRGAYSGKTTGLLFTANTLSVMIPEKPYVDLHGHSTSDVCYGIPALQPEDLWHLERRQH